MVFGLFSGLSGLFWGFVTGGILGFIAALPLMFLCAGSHSFYRGRAARLERELRELERS
jgi:hypothetical protein